MILQTPPCPSPIELSEADAPEVADLYGRCADYFMLQDGEEPTLADAHALFTDVPSGKEPRDQIVLGWRRGEGLDAVAAILRDYPDDGIWYLGFMLVDSGCGAGALDGPSMQLSRNGPPTGARRKSAWR